MVRGDRFYTNDCTPTENRGRDGNSVLDETNGMKAKFYQALSRKNLRETDRKDVLKAIIPDNENTDLPAGQWPAWLRGECAEAASSKSLVQQKGEGLEQIEQLTAERYASSPFVHAQHEFKSSNFQEQEKVQRVTVQLLDGHIHRREGKMVSFLLGPFKLLILGLSILKLTLQESFAKGTAQDAFQITIELLFYFMVHHVC